MPKNANVICERSLTVLDAACTNYEVLDDARRHYTKSKTRRKVLCDSDTAPSRWKNNWKGRNFYRIMGPAGTRIKEGCVASNDACGTNMQGFISSGTHPALLNQRATLTVCFTKNFRGQNLGHNRICHYCNEERNIDIEVINCGSYFVYDLPSIDRCAYAYCTE